MLPEELKARLDAGEDVVVVDVREPAEVEELPYPFPVLPIPLLSLPRRVGELPADRDVVVACHSGSRSASAVRFLRQSGLERVHNLDGGIVGWAGRVGGVGRRR